MPKSACGFSFGSFSLTRARNGVHVFVISVFSFFPFLSFSIEVRKITSQIRLLINSQASFSFPFHFYDKCANDDRTMANPVAICAKYFSRVNSFSFALTFAQGYRAYNITSAQYLLIVDEKWLTDWPKNFQFDRSSMTDCIPMAECGFCLICQMAQHVVHSASLPIRVPSGRPLISSNHFEKQQQQQWNQKKT